MKTVCDRCDRTSEQAGNCSCEPQPGRRQAFDGPEHGEETRYSEQQDVEWARVPRVTEDQQRSVPGRGGNDDHGAG